MRHRRPGARGHPCQLVSDAIYKKVTADAKVTEAEAKAYYDGHHGSVHDAADTRRQPHPRQGQEARRQALRPAEGRRRASPPLAKKYSEDPGSKAAGRPADRSPSGQTVARVRQGRVRAQDRRDLEAGQDPVRLAHHPGDATTKPRQGDALREGQGGDPATAAPAEADRRSRQVARRGEEGVRVEDVVRDGPRAGTDDHVGHHHVGNDHWLSPVGRPWPKRCSIFST